MSARLWMSHQPRHDVRLRIGTTPTSWNRHGICGKMSATGECPKSDTVNARVFRHSCTNDGTAIPTSICTHSEKMRTVVPVWQSHLGLSSCSIWPADENFDIINSAVGLPLLKWTDPFSITGTFPSDQILFWCKVLLGTPFEINRPFFYHFLPSNQI